MLIVDVKGGTAMRRVARAPCAPLRSRAIVAIKLVHSAIFLVNSAAILHVFVAGVRDRPSRWTGAALAVAFTEVAVFLANRGRCPLTDLVERLGAANGRVSDIFLPRWFADRIPQLCGPLLLVGALALLWRRCLAVPRHGTGRRPASRDCRARPRADQGPTLW
jgi:hypothetical protein